MELFEWGCFGNYPTEVEKVRFFFSLLNICILFTLDTYLWLSRFRPRTQWWGSGVCPSLLYWYRLNPGPHTCYIRSLLLSFSSQVCVALGSGVFSVAEGRGREWGLWHSPIGNLKSEMLLSHTHLVLMASLWEQSVSFQKWNRKFQNK